MKYNIEDVRHFESDKLGFLRHFHERTDIIRQDRRRQHPKL